MECGTGEEALKACRDHRPRLIFAAFKLPDHQGPDLCRKIKGDPSLRGISVIVVCETDQPWQIEESRKAGCDGVLVKPLDKHKFLEVGSQFVSTIRAPRHACLVPVVVRSGEREIKCKCLDISTGGIFLQCQEHFSEGDRFDMSFVLPVEPEQTLACTGVVAWKNDKDHPFKAHFPVGFGIRFQKVSETAKNLIRRFVDGEIRARQG